MTVSYETPAAPVATLRIAGIGSPWIEKRRNSCPDPSFEAGNVTWSFSGSASGVHSTDWAQTGARSMKVTAGSTNRVAGDIRYGSLTAFPAGMAPGGTYTVSAYIYTPAAHIQLDTSLASRQRRMLVFIGGPGALVTQVFGPQAPNEPGVHRVSRTFTIPADATGVIVSVGCAGSASEPNFVTYVDAVQQETGAALSEYIDGDTNPDGDLERTRWIGTANASASVLETRDQGEILRATGGTITLDENYSPYVSASVTVQLTSAGIGELIDPRQDQRVTVTAADESLSFLPPRVFDLGIRDRTVDHAQQTLTIEAASDEAKLHDTKRLATTIDRSARAHETSLRGIVGWALDKIGAVLDPAGPDVDMTAQWNATNMLKNPSAATGITDWLSGSASTAIAWNSGVGVGGKAGFLRATQSGVSGAVYLSGAATGSTPVRPGDMHTVSAHVRASAAGSTLTISIRYFDPQGAVLRNVTVPSTSVGTAWERRSITGTAPANAASMVAYVSIFNSASGRTWDIDDAMISVGPVLLDYFDGSTPSTANYIYAWEDAANASSSTRTATPERPPDLFDWAPGDSLFDFLRPFLEASALRLWCDEQRVWRLAEPGATDFGNLVEAYATGTYGPTSVGNTVDGRDVISRDRDDWGTGVVVAYEWFDETGSRSTMFDAAGTDGKVIVIKRSTPYPGPGAAATILAAISQRGRTQSATITRGFQASPGYYSRVTLPGTAQQDGRVRRVVFDLATGNAEISTNGTENP
ncbi:hypothetical protein ACTJJ4_11050 [Microbacterium sp. 22195]|uniref:hypothetical protein n=1 Tax=Microbacterium sp. 22195 TaxID=3453891 RepID=UPI003F84C867